MSNSELVKWENAVKAATNDLTVRIYTTQDPTNFTLTYAKHYIDGYARMLLNAGQNHVSVLERAYTFLKAIGVSMQNIPQLRQYLVQKTAFEVYKYVPEFDQLKVEAHLTFSFPSLI